jgi:hypothetical protein
MNMKPILDQTCYALPEAVRRTVCAGLLVALLASWTVSAGTLYVWQDSPNPTPPFDSWANAATTIQDAVDAAHPGDLVLVTNGVYATGGRTAFGDMTRVAIDKAITVQSVNGPEATVIEGGPGIRAAYVGTNAFMSGFTLTKGVAEIGGGAVCENTATLMNCILTGNTASYAGGGSVRGTLYNCILTGNSATLGGGSIESKLYNCTLIGNSAGLGGGAGGGTPLLHHPAAAGRNGQYHQRPRIRGPDRGRPPSALRLARH